MDNISNLIEVLTEYLINQNETTQKSHLFTTENIAVFAALLTFGGLLYTVRRNSKLQNANARVEWIQSVRNVTAEIISSYSSALNEDDPDEVQKVIVEVREKIERLILFFGHETKKEKDIDVLNMKSNKGKNSLIVDFLTQLSDDFLKYNKNVKSRLYPQAKARLDNLNSKQQDNVIDNIYHGEIEAGGEYYPDIEPVFDEGFEKKLTDAQIRENEIKEFNKKLDNNLVKLRNIIRIYLKIEWNKAKKGK